MAKDKTTFQVSLEELLESGAHFGHIVRRWNPKMRNFIWMSRDGVHIFDLAKTAEALVEACTAMAKAVAEGKRVLFVGTKRQAQDIVKKAAIEAGVPYITERWLGGTITNWNMVKARIAHLKDLREKREKGEFKSHTKKERVLIDREIDKLTRFFGGIESLTDVPEVIFVVDTHKERVAMREAASRKITVIGITDSNANPDLVAYPIPANDDAIKSVSLIVDKMVEAVKEGKKASK